MSQSLLHWGQAKLFWKCTPLSTDYKYDDLYLPSHFSQFIYDYMSNNSKFSPFSRGWRTKPSGGLLEDLRYEQNKRERNRAVVWSENGATADWQKKSISYSAAFHIVTCATSNQLFPTWECRSTNHATVYSLCKAHSCEIWQTSPSVRLLKKLREK